MLEEILGLLTTPITITQQWVTSPVEIAATVLAMLGAYLVSRSKKHMFEAHVIYLFANICWVIFAYFLKSPGLILTQCFFTYTALNGIRTYYPEYRARKRGSLSASADDCSVILMERSSHGHAKQQQHPIRECKIVHPIRPEPAREGTGSYG